MDSSCIGAIIIWKEYSFRLVMRRSVETNSSSLKADAWHHRSDAITSVAAFIGISVALLLGKGYESADDWAALFASGFIHLMLILLTRTW
jgi:divalent metal cation (Fe/Co/Zn/Cd) transporter